MAASHTHDDDLHSGFDSPRPAKRRRVLAHDKYTVAWICALPLERSAACAMLDETHADLPVDATDSNSYTLGSMAGHNVVIVCLPLTQIGNNSASTVVTNLIRSFKFVRIGFMVGIGGGVPSARADIRLGDVVLGTRVMQYDMGKILNEGLHMNADWRRPQQSLLALVSKYRSEHDLRPSRIPLVLAERMGIYPGFQRPDIPDVLFQPSYEHVPSESGCEACDVDRLVPRQLRSSTDPEIFFGAIASGNAVMRSGTIRDRIARKLDVVCYEMEAAGLMDILPCLPIRGICDYADSHKSKEWQVYAAATAAACTRELLEMVALPSGRPVCLDSPGKTASGPADRRKDILDSLRFDQIELRRINIKAAHARTCHWFHQLPDYQQWLDLDLRHQHRGFLWIKGKPGAGKSTIMKFLYTKMRKRRTTKETVTASFFFHARGVQLGRSVWGMYRSLLLQLLEGFPDLQKLLDDTDLIPNSYDTACPPLNVLQDIFREAVLNLGSARSFTCFIDALDESDEQQVMDLVQFFEDLAEECTRNDTHLHVCFSSRHYPYIIVRHGISLVLEEQDGHAEDLAQYTRSHLRVRDASMMDDIQSEILKKASGVFLWVVLVCDILNRERGGMSLRRRLAEVPVGLTELFRDMLIRDNKDTHSLLLCILWILLAAEPLSPRELHHAVWAGCRVKSPDLFDPSPPIIEGDDANRIIQSYITDFSKGLAETSSCKKDKRHGADKRQEPVVQFIHESVRDFLIKEDGLRELWPEVSFEWQSEGHETLKRSCMEYLKHFYDETERQHKNSIQLKSHNVLHTSRFAFLRYACQHMFFHANEAVNVIPQVGMLSSFSVEPWIAIFNHFESYKARRYPPRQTLLYLLAERGHASLVRACLDLGHTAFYEGGRYGHPFFAAWASGNKDTCAAILGISSTMVNGKDVCEGQVRSRLSDHFSQHTLLTWAARMNRLGIAKVLIDGGCPVDEENSRGFSPLMVAIGSGHEDMVRLLLREGALVHGTRAPWQLSRMFVHAAEHRLLWLMKFLFQKGAAVHVPMSTALEPSELPIISALAGCSCKEHASNDVVAIIDWLFSNGAQVEYTTEWRHSEKFQLGLWSGLPPEVYRILARNGLDLNAVDNTSGSTILLHLITSKELSCPVNSIAKLVEGGADANASDRCGTTPLLAATETFSEEAEVRDYQSSLKLVELLLNEGANPRASNRKGSDPLMNVIERSPPDFQSEASSIVKLMVEKGADVHSQRTCGRTPLATAVITGNAACVRVLLGYRASIFGNESTSEDISARVPYQSKRHSRIHEGLKLLVDGGVEVNLRLANGETFLYKAALIRDLSATELLLSYGVELEYEKAKSVIPLVLLLCAERPELRDVILELYSAWFVYTVKFGRRSGQFVTYAMFHGTEAVVEALRRQGVKLDGVDADGAGETALHVACAQGKLEVARELLDAGALVDAENNKGRTVLTEAVEKGSEDMVELLIAHKADPRLCDLRRTRRLAPYLASARKMVILIEDQRSIWRRWHNG